MVFMERCLALCRPGGFVMLVHPPNWTFLGSGMKLREHVLRNHLLRFIVNLGERAFLSNAGQMVRVGLTIIVRGGFTVEEPEFRPPAVAWTGEGLVTGEDMGPEAYLRLVEECAALARAEFGIPAPAPVPVPAPPPVPAPVRDLGDRYQRMRLF
jgi:hypothetical protein